MSPPQGSPRRVPSGAGPRPRAALAEGLRFPRQTPPALPAPARPGDLLQPRAAPGGPARPSPSAAPARPPSPSSVPMLPHSRGHSGLGARPKGPAAPDPFHRGLPQARARRSAGARRRSQLRRAREPQPQLGTGRRLPRPHSPPSGTALSHALLRCPGAGAARPRLRTALPVPAGSGGRSALQEGAESSYFLPKCQLLRRAASPGPPPASSSAAARAWGWHPSGSAPFRFLLQELGTASAIEGLVGLSLSSLYQTGMRPQGPMWEFSMGRDGTGSPAPSTPLTLPWHSGNTEVPTSSPQTLWPHSVGAGAGGSVLITCPSDARLGFPAFGWEVAVPARCGR